MIALKDRMCSNPKVFSGDKGRVLTPCTAACRRSIPWIPNKIRMPYAYDPAGKSSAVVAAARETTPEIKVIASDIDGTLFGTSQELSSRNEAAIKAVSLLGIPFILATGKAKGPWFYNLYARLELSTPVAFMQGLFICDSQGNTLRSVDMDHSLLRSCIATSRELGINICVYSQDRLLSPYLNEHTERLKFYREPLVEAVDDFESIVGTIPIQKLVFMTTPERVSEIRPEIERRCGNEGSVTSAIPGWIEVLPRNSSKGEGLSWLLNRMGLSPATLMAIGDGENDVEMFELSAWAVAMGNAGEPARRVSNTVVSKNDEDGVAEAIERFVLEPRGLTIEKVLAGAAR